MAQRGDPALGLSRRIGTEEAMEGFHSELLLECSHLGWLLLHSLHDGTTQLHFSFIKCLGVNL